MALKLLSLDGLRALVTGAGTGLGKQMALGLAEAGASLVICGRRQVPLEETAAAARAFGVEVEVIPTDVTVETDVQALFDGAGHIDILVNNAGSGGPFRPWTDVTSEEWRSVLALNLDAPFRLIQLFAPQMMERRWGRIINISSIYGIVGADPSRYPGLGWDIPAYFASKFGLNGVTHYLAPRLAPFGVCINSLCPGMFASEQTEQMLSQAVVDRLIDGTPARRMGGCDDLKATVVYLASPGSAFVTGQNLVVDGGWTVW
jgi:NAD(P)-dependent dehydrogenase (short-subunit alcohol dehydrogenase family)